jgi:hypothetical protein
METNKLPKLIGIHGHARSGKDTVAEFLVSTYKDTFSESFASPLKDACSAAFGIYRAYFDSPEFKETPVPGWEVSPRAIAQFVGTELFRSGLEDLIEGLGTNFWIERLERRLTNAFIPDEEGEYLPEHTVVIPDVRFQNELDWVLSNNGIIIHLTRAGADGKVGILGHASESTLDLTSGSIYHVENNSSLSELYSRVANIVMASNY